MFRDRHGEETMPMPRKHDRNAPVRSLLIHLEQAWGPRWEDACLAGGRYGRYKPRDPYISHSPVTKTITMTIERTFSIIKPDATERNLTGAINAMIEQAGLRIIAQKRVRITREQAETFYAVHRARPFFGELVDFMISGPVVVQVLEGDNAIARYRDVMGATDPAKAAAGTIRKVHAKSIGENSVHGSDAPETAAMEIAQFFSGNEIVP
jgi:nucleoside-diphosphate kinase